MFAIWLVVLLIGFVGCSAREKEEPRVVQTAVPADALVETSWLSRYDLKAKNPKQFKLPKKLGEISGLAITDDGKLLCHDDESAIVYQLDYVTGSITRQFAFGSGFLKGDFEGIAVKRDTIYVVNSSGTLFEFREAAEGGRTAFRQYKTSLSQKNDVEGLEYDPQTDCLLLACKGDAGKGYGGYKAVYAFSLKTKELIVPPRFLISLDAVKKTSKGSFNPSGIARHPVSGTFFVISADGESIIEIDSSGKLLGQEEIPKKVNSQPEGIAFAPDNSLLLCNDGQGGTGTLTVYPAR